MLTNLIFLDVDGVLNMFGSSCRTFMKPHGQHIEPHIVSRLNYICEKVDNLSIVISSSWRGDMDDLQNQLVEQGFKHWHLVVGKTPKSYRAHLDYSVPAELLLNYRGEQIQDWIDKNNFSGKYLVIDDEMSDICGEMCSIIPKEYSLQTDMNEGMLNKDALFIVEYFKSK